jgi:hypothetical protein
MKIALVYFSVLSVALLGVVPSEGLAQELRPLQGVPLPPAQSRVERLTDTNMGVVLDRRAIRNPLRYTGDTRVSSVDIASSSESLSYERSGVVYNYALQAYGVVSGEISFKVRDRVDASVFAWGRTPPPRRLVGATVFVVNAPTLDEFLRVMKMLRGDGRVQWVEPAVEYISLPIK